METNKLITIKQMPVIEQRLKELSDEIDKKVDIAQSMICTEENKQEVKKMRTELKNDFKILEEQRKMVKNKVLEPYNAFEEIYKKYVTDKFKVADADLTNKINFIETEQKQVLENNAKDYFNEYTQSKNIDFINFEQIGLKIGVSDNDTKLRKLITAFVDKIAGDLQLIDTQENKEEILVEYKQSLNVVNSINTVKNRIKAIEEEKKRQEELARIKEQEQKTVEKVEAVVEEKLEAPVVVGVDLGKEESIQVEEPIYTMTFYVRGNKYQLKAIKQFLEDGGYDYGSVK